MILWHLGVTALIVYVTLGRARVDYRFVLAGAIAPDVVDALVGLLGPGGVTDRRYGHTLLAGITVTLAILALTKGTRRLSLFGLGVGWIVHLVLDGMWSAPRTFFWPAFGSAFADSRSSYSAGDVGLWLGELAGGAILVWFWVAFELGKGGRGARWLRDGKLRA